ncbi:hypothetical protein V6N13_076934 [Hibiscus sabdariffa]
MFRFEMSMFGKEVKLRRKKRVGRDMNVCVACVACNHRITTWLQLVSAGFLSTRGKKRLLNASIADAKAVEGELKNDAAAVPCHATMLLNFCKLPPALLQL